MAIVIISVEDSNGDDFSNGGCLEDIRGNLTYTIEAGNLDPTSIVNQEAYIDGTFVDNGDGTYTFDLDPDILAANNGLCIPTIEFIPIPCEETCPEITIEQTVINGELTAQITLDTELDVTNLDINGNVFTSNVVNITDTVSSDCYTYTIELLLQVDCLFIFTITIPACTFTGSWDGCEDVDECNSNVPTLSYVCLNNGDVQVTADNGATDPVLSEITQHSVDQVTWTNFVSTFTPTTETGYIRYSVDYDDGCPPKTITIEYICAFECTNTSILTCNYNIVSNTFTITAVDTFEGTIVSDTAFYFPDGATVGIPYTIGDTIDATGINEIDVIRDVVFEAPCPVEQFTTSCAKVTDCDYTGYDVSCALNEGAQAVLPYFIGDESILIRNEKRFSVDGSNYAPYTGGAIATTRYATFTWIVQIPGCDPEIFTSSCYFDCPCPTIENNCCDEMTEDCPDSIECQELCSRWDETNGLISEVTLEDATLLSSVTGFSFPYSAVGDLQTDLNTWLSAMECGGSATVQLEDVVGGDPLVVFNKQICVKITDSVVDFGSVSISSLALTTVVPFGECRAITCNADKEMTIIKPACQTGIDVSASTCLDYKQIFFIDSGCDCFPNVANEFSFVSEDAIASWNLTPPCPAFNMALVSQSSNQVTWSYIKDDTQPNCPAPPCAPPADFAYNYDGYAEIEWTDVCGNTGKILILFGEC